MSGRKSKNDCKKLKGNAKYGDENKYYAKFDFRDFENEREEEMNALEERMMKEKERFVWE